MATPDNSLNAIASLLQLFQGQKSSGTQTQTSGGGTSTETSGTNLDQNALAGLLKSALESNQGLAAVTQGQKGAGLYNASTNRLLTNDLLARLTARTAEAGAQKTTTRTTTPTTTTTQNNATQGGVSKAQGTDLAKLMAGMKVYNELGGTKTIKGALGTDVGEAAMYAAGGGSVPFTDLMSANMTSDPLGALISSQGWSDISGGEQAIANAVPQSMWDAFDTQMAEYLGTNASVASDTLATAGGDVANAVAPVAEDTVNFSGASDQILKTGGTPSSSEVLSEAGSSSADTTSLSNATSAASGAWSYSASAASNIPSQSFAAGSAMSNVGTSGAGNVGSYGEFASQSSTATELTSNASSTGGNILGYIGPVMDAFNAQNNPKGEQNPDYRRAVGGAILNYFGFGWATPIVDAIAKPILNEAMEAGNKSLGNFGTVLADPIGAPLSGQYDVGDLITSTLDPANIFGGNEGGSVGGLVGAVTDPIGAALGGEGLSGAVSGVVNQIDSAISPGRVVCTELALAGHLDAAKYQQVIQPKITLKGRILLGYHVLGVPAVRKLRADPRFVQRALPYVNAYLDHKLGKKNWRGFLIKNIGEPLCWILSFFNTDPDYYKVLYPYRRVRNGH